MFCYDSWAKLNFVGKKKEKNTVKPYYLKILKIRSIMWFITLKKIEDFYLR